MGRSIYATEGGRGGLSADAALGNFRALAVVAADGNNDTTEAETRTPCAVKLVRGQNNKEANVEDVQ